MDSFFFSRKRGRERERERNGRVLVGKRDRFRISDRGRLKVKMAANSGRPSFRFDDKDVFGIPPCPVGYFSFVLLAECFQ